MCRIYHKWQHVNALLYQVQYRVNLLPNDVYEVSYVSNNTCMYYIPHNVFYYVFCNTVLSLRDGKVLRKVRTLACTLRGCTFPIGIEQCTKQQTKTQTHTKYSIVYLVAYNYGKSLVCMPPSRNTYIVCNNIPVIYSRHSCIQTACT